MLLRSRLFTHSSSNLQRLGKRRVIKVAAYEILWVEAKGEGLELSFLERDAKPRLALVKIEGKIKDGESSGVDAVGWCEELMSAAYAGPGMFCLSQ